MSSKRFYIRKQVVSFEEDFTHEFKGHRNLCVEELPPWTKATKTQRASRKAVSRTLNAFLNTGKGGTAYLGVVDSGHVQGLPLTTYQQEHVKDCLQDLMHRYNPPVPAHRYRLRFIPVVSNEEEAKQLSASPLDDQGFNDQRPHELRTHNYCWCDKEAVMKYNSGILIQDYVIEIKIRAWDPDLAQNAEIGCGMVINLHPIHEDEEGQCYFRRQASVVKYNMTEIAQLTRQEVQEACQLKIERLEREIEVLRQRHGEKPD